MIQVKNISGGFQSSVRSEELLKTRFVCTRCGVARRLTLKRTGTNYIYFCQDCRQADGDCVRAMRGKDT